MRTLTAEQISKFNKYANENSKRRIRVKYLNRLFSGSLDEDAKYRYTVGWFDNRKNARKFSGKFIF